MTNEATAGEKRSTFFFFTHSSTHLSLPVRFWLRAPPFLCVFSLPRHVFQVGFKECGACVPFNPSAYGLNWEPVQGVCLPRFTVHAGNSTWWPRENETKKKKAGSENKGRCDHSRDVMGCRRIRFWTSGLTSAAGLSAIPFLCINGSVVQNDLTRRSSQSSFWWGKFYFVIKKIQPLKQKI